MNFDEDDEIWRPLIMGHLATLRTAFGLEHLVLDAHLYLLALPPFVREWCCRLLWEEVLEFLRSLGDEADRVTTLLDDSHIAKASK